MSGGSKKPEFKRNMSNFKSDLKGTTVFTEGNTTGRFSGLRKHRVVAPRGDDDDMSEGQQALLNEIEAEEMKWQDPFYDPDEDYSGR